MSSLSDDQLARLRELTDNATPGPWGWRGHDTGQIECVTLHSGQLRIIGALRSDPCIVTLDDESLALAYLPCDSCRKVYTEGDLFEGHRCEKPENLGTVWLWDKGFVSPANQWAVREQPYRSDVKAVEHPDAEFIAAAREAVPALLDEIDWLKAWVDALLVDAETKQADLDRLRARLAHSQAEIDRLRVENEMLAVRWQQQFDRAERVEATAIRDVPAILSRVDAAFSHGSNEAEVQALYEIYDWAAGLPVAGSGELTSGTEPETVPLSTCAHVVTGEEGTSHCSLAERQVREVEAQRDGLIEAARALAEDVGTYGPGSLIGRLVEQCDRAEGEG